MVPAGAGKGARSVTVKNQRGSSMPQLLRCRWLLSKGYISGGGEKSGKTIFKVTDGVGSDGKAWLGQKSNR